jgi:formylmethanofuran:tetrahydromethanopterin formyltransferase
MSRIQDSHVESQYKFYEANFNQYRAPSTLKKIVRNSKVPVGSVVYKPTKLLDCEPTLY